MDTKGAIQSVYINGLSVLSRLNLEEDCKGFLSPGTKQTVHNNKLPELSGHL